MRNKYLDCEGLEALIGLIKNELKNMVYDVDYNATTGELTFYRSKGNITRDLPLELIISNGAYDSEAQKIILTLASGAPLEIPLEELSAKVLADAKAKYDAHSAEVDEKLTTMQNQVNSINDLASGFNNAVDAILKLQGDYISGGIV